MGRATVLSGGAEGLYTVRLDFGKAQRDARVAKLDARLLELDAQLAEMDEVLADFEAQVTEARVAAHAAIDAYAQAMQVQPPPPDLEALAEHMNALVAAVYERESRLQVLRGPPDMLRAERAAADQERAGLMALQVELVRDAWCADYTTDASGEVATVEVPGEPQAVVLAPGGRAPVAADGVLRARGLMSPAQAFANAALLPGWQRWMPTFRAGTVLAVDFEAHTADVELDAAQSSAAGLSVMRGPLTLSNVPVQYMTCHARAFEVGDRVLVALVDGSWESPRLVGFLNNPRACVRWPQYLLLPVQMQVDAPTYSGTTTTLLRTTNWGGSMIATGRDGLQVTRVQTPEGAGSRVAYPGEISDLVDVVHPGAVYFEGVSTAEYSLFSASPATEFFCSAEDVVIYDVSVTNRLDIFERAYPSGLRTICNPFGCEFGQVTGWDVREMTQFSGQAAVMNRTVVSEGSAAGLFVWLSAAGALPEVVAQFDGQERRFVLQDLLQTGSSMSLRYRNEGDL